VSGPAEEPRGRAAGAAGRARVLLLAVPAAALIATAGLLWSVTATISAEIGRELAEERVHLEKVQGLERAAATARATVMRQWLSDPGERAAQRDEIVEAVQGLRRAMDALRELTPLDDVERAAAARLLSSAALLSNQLLQAMLAVDPGAAASELSLAMDAVDAHARAVTAVTADAGSSTDARLSLLRGRQVFIQAAFILVALSILFIAAGLSRRQLRASEEMRRVQAHAARQRAQFFANMSHELRTPLVAIRGFASMISIEPAAGAAAQEHAEQIEAQAQDLLGIINNILDSAKLEAGRVELSVEDVDVAEAVERCVQRCRGLVGDKALELTSTVPAGLHARADFVKLQQVFTNLIGNAVKFTERGRVEVRARAAGDVVEIEVADTGIGIDPAALPHLWEPFHQGSGAVDRRFGGTGLGLSIVHGLVERMGGDVRVQSAPGRGSTFTVTLPLAARGAPTASTPSTPSTPSTLAAPDPRALKRAS
jgi:signal transduction histidine kinase